MKILFIDIDTLRADHMGCYGYQRNTTPNMDEIAGDGVIFDNYYCSDAPCLPARASLVSGLLGIRSGAVGHGGTCADRRLSGENRGFRDRADTENLFNLFRRAGMYTASISTFAERHSSWWFNAGFNETHNQGGGGMESGEDVLPAALDWLSRNRERENWFLHLHLWDPHTPYRAPESFGNPFESEPLDTWITQEVFEKHLSHTGPHSALDINMYDDRTNPKYPRHPGKITDLCELKNLFNQYDTGIKYADHLIGQVFAELREQGIFDDVSVIISSDHGENMGELGIYAEHATADHPTCRIPMIVKWQGGVKNHRDGGLHYNLDLVPTVAELLKLKKSDNWDGMSYADTLLYGKSAGWNSLVLSQMAHVCQRSARFGDWLYVRTYHDGFHLFDSEMLFNITEDPHEQNDVKEQYPEVCQKGAKIILDWHDGAMIKSGSLIDPMWQVLREGGPFHAKMEHLPAYLERLESTGRKDGADRLREKYLK